MLCELQIVVRKQVSVLLAICKFNLVHSEFDMHLLTGYLNSMACDLTPLRMSSGLSGTELLPGTCVQSRNLLTESVDPSFNSVLDILPALTPPGLNGVK